MKEKQVFLTIDTGGSKSKLTMYDVSNGFLGDRVCRGFGAALESDEPLPELTEALQGFTAGYQVESVVCNLGGRNKKQVTTVLHEVFGNIPVQVFRESEGTAGVELCKMYDAQVVLMAGTGSIAVAPVQEKIIISGGWGANISDKGSGYAIGLEAVRLALEEFDGTAPFSDLTKYLTGLSAPPQVLTAEEYCDLRDRVRENLAPLDRHHIASLVKTVFECACMGDEKAVCIYQRAGRDLASIVLAAGAKTGKPLSNIIVTGGLVHSRKAWQGKFERAIREKHQIKNVYYIADGIAEAMANIAKKEC